MLRTIFALLIVASVLGGVACGLRLNGTATNTDASMPDATGDDASDDASDGGADASGDGCALEAGCGVTPVELVGNGYHFCVRTRSGDAYCWGRNLNGELGVGDVAEHIGPVRVARDFDGGSLLPFAGIAAGWTHTCARTSDDAIYCWGDNTAGQAGQPVMVPSTPLPTRVGAFFGGSVAAGGLHSCAIDHALRVQCWGDNTNAELGYAPGSRTDAGEVFYGGGGWANANPTQAALTETAAGMALMYRASCAIVTDGGVRCWGSGTFAELGGPASGTPTPTPQTVALGAGATAIGGMYHAACAALANAGARCWGENDWGNLGSAPAATVTPPLSFGSETDVTSVAPAIQHTCVVANGRVRCAGWNGEGELGNGSLGGDAGCPTFAAGQTPDQCITGIVDVGLTFVVEVAASASSTCARTTAGKIHCWGENQFGQLGHAPGTSGDLPCRSGLSMCNASPVEVKFVP